MSRKERLKVYHGIPKSVTDKHTVFYASFDGSINPEVGEYPSQNRATLLGFKPSYTGYGVTAHDGRIVYPLRNLSDTTTIEFFFSEIPDGRRVLGIRNNDKEILSVFTHIGYLWIGDITLLIAKQQKINHVRLVITKNTRTVYFNGKLLSIQTVTTEAFNQLCLFDFRNDGNASSNCTISDVHISNIDRGDYFPNLPQDFIDGKAIIKPRMGQQQIKGDPMYNQETTDVVKIGSNVNEPQITCSRTSGNWTNGDTIKIKGLGGEIISGIFDTDTALARVKRVINSKQIFVLDSVQKLSVNDVVRFNVGSSYSPEATISKIESDTNTITLSVPLSEWEVMAEYYLVETTTTSSSPIVKSSDGTTITGTWNNLGTNEATFTLGTNSTLTNQDLYATYSLNIPAGNSDFTELPYSIEKVYDEVGNELVEVSEIFIEDDFYGKVKGDYSICPHYSGITASTGLAKIAGFVKDAYITSYNLMDSLDSTLMSNYNANVGQKLQQIFAFNILEVVERKIGKIPSNDKVQWLRDNLTRVNFIHYGFVENSGAYGLNIACYNYKTQEWQNAVKHTGSNVTKLNFALVNNAVIKDSRIDDNGFVYFLVYTDTITTNTRIYTDYAKIEVTLPVDTTFTTFYSDNKRAREIPCNPILIQKKTKTIKRYLPSKECFVTEILNYGYKTNHIENFWGKVLATQNDKIVTSNGTGSYVSGINGDIDYSDKVPIPSTTSKTYEFKNELLNIYSTDNVSNCSHSVRLPIVRYWGGKRYVGVGDSNSGIDNCATLMGDFDNKNYNLYEFFGQLRESNKELYLTVQSTKRIQGNKGLPPIGLHWTYKLPNRPLIK